MIFYQEPKIYMKTHVYAQLDAFIVRVIKYNSNTVH